MNTKVVMHSIKVKLFFIACNLAGMLIQTSYALANTDNFSAIFNFSSYLPTDQPSPQPGFSPEEVVAIQLKAFQENDESDRGIETVFMFAAPENKKYTGPIDFFKALVRNPTYDPLLNCKKFDARKMHIKGNEAQQIVVITDKNGRKAAYLFSLSKQAEGIYKGCWMTDSVIRLEYQEKTKTVSA